MDSMRRRREARALHRRSSSGRWRTALARPRRRFSAHRDEGSSFRSSCRDRLRGDKKDRAKRKGDQNSRQGKKIYIPSCTVTSFPPRGSCLGFLRWLRAAIKETAWTLDTLRLTCAGEGGQQLMRGDDRRCPRNSSGTRALCAGLLPNAP